MTNEPKYPVMEHFPTIQGEGAHAGKAAYFVRLGGCDVGCRWCDVKESWPVDSHPQMSVSQIVENITGSGFSLAVITGGEPLMHNLDALTDSLQKHNIRSHIETSGAHPLSGKWDWITFSPKKFKAPLPETVKMASELKVVIFNKSDFAFAEKWANEVNEKCQLYLQPEWDKRADMTPLIVDFVKQNPRWRVSLQTHKYMNIP